MNYGAYFWIEVILALLVGILAAAGMIAAKQPNAGAAIAKLVPYQGIIGVIGLLYSIIFLIGLFDGIGFAFQIVPVLTLLMLAMPILTIVLGFMFGWSLISKVTGGGQGDAAAAKVASVQGPLGIATIIVTVILVICLLFSIAI